MITERKAIQEELEFIREERRRLSEQYFSLLDRLRDLDNMEREAVDTEAVIEHMKQTTHRLCDLLPEVTPEQVIAQLKQELPVEELVEEHHVHEETNIQTSDIQLAQIRDEKHTVSRRHRAKGTVEWVVVLLQEAGRPMRIKEIAEQLEDRYHITWSNPTNMMSRLMELNPRIERASKGFYQYR